MSSGTTSLCLKLEDEEVAMAVGGQETKKPEPKEEKSIYRGLQAE